MDLSSYLVKAFVNGDCEIEQSLPGFKRAARELTRQWWLQNPDTEQRIRGNFEFATQRPFACHRDTIRDAMADHYAEKLATLLFSRAEMARICAAVELPAEVVESIRATLARGTIVFVASGHLGGIEWLPTTLAQHGIPNAIVVNFKTEEARLRCKSQAEAWDVDILDFAADNSRYLRNLRKQPRAIISVIDAFDEWDRSNPTLRAVLFGRECTLDNRIERLVRLLRAEVYWAVMDRTGEESYRLDLSMQQPTSNVYMPTLMSRWSDAVLRSNLWYIWHELNALFDASAPRSHRRTG